MASETVFYNNKSLSGIGSVDATTTTISATPAAAANVLTVRGSSTTGNVVQFSNTAGGTFIMTSAGSVGIGTTDPQSSLHVASNVQIGVGQNGTRLLPAVLTMNTLSISQNGTATTPQTLIRLQWKEDSFDLGSGEGCGIAFALSLTADNVHYDGCRIASFKETGVDADREQALTFWTSTDGGVTAPAERMRITSAGRVGIGITNPSVQLELSTDGARKLTTSTWSTGSDQRIKTEIQSANLQMCYDTVKSIDLKHFKWNFPDVQVEDAHMLGFIAQEVRPFFPNSVKESNSYGYSDFLALDTDQVLKAMYGALRQTMADKEEIESKLQTAQNDIDLLKSRLAAIEARSPQ